MTIYGVGLLALCFIVGQLTGELLGILFNIESNVGGVGFAMLLLILCTNWLKKKNLFHLSTEQGIGFWNSMYIPIIVAMSAIQNVRVAFSSGYIAILVGIFPTLCLIMLVPALTRMKKNKPD